MVVTSHSKKIGKTTERGLSPRIMVGVMLVTLVTMYTQLEYVLVVYFTVFTLNRDSA